MAKINDIIKLQKQDVKVVACKSCNKLMVNIDASDIERGDFVTLKRLGILISNPETDFPICIHCENIVKPTFKQKVVKWYDNDDDDDSSLFSSGGLFHGSSSSGGFGGFGGGMFGGGGASRGF